MSDLEQALTLTSTGDGTWSAVADPRYVSTNAMFGGWTTAVALRAAILGSADDAVPSAVTINFVDRIEPGSDVAIRTTRVGGSRSITHWLSELTDRVDGRMLLANERTAVLVSVTES